MKLIINSTLKVSSSFGFCLLASIVSSNEKVYANTCESLFGNNPTSINDSCYITPSTYKIRVYEMGLCTSDPLAGTSIDSSENVTTDNTISFSSCTPTSVSYTHLTLPTKNEV